MKDKRSYVLYGLLLLAIVFLGLLAWGNLPFLDPLRSALGLRAKVTSGEVVEKVRAASLLTTTKYTIKVVARNFTPGNLFGWFGATMLLSAKGTVEAGIDLSEIDPSDVSVSADGKSITLTLPPVMIRNRDYSLSDDPRDTGVKDVDKGVWVDTTNQQTELYSAANDELVKSACKAGIMRRATSDARLVVEALLKTLWPDLTVTVLSGPVPSVEQCMAE